MPRIRKWNSQGVDVIACIVGDRSGMEDLRLETPRLVCIIEEVIAYGYSVADELLVGHMVWHKLLRNHRETLDLIADDPVLKDKRTVDCDVVFYAVIDERHNPSVNERSDHDGERVHPVCVR